MKLFLGYILMAVVVLLIADAITDWREESRRRSWQENERHLSPAEIEAARERWETEQDLLDPGNHGAWER